MSTRSVCAAVIVWVTCALACSVGPDSSFTDLQPLVFPAQAELGAETPGSTVAVFLDSNYLWPADIAELHSLDASRVALKLRKDTEVSDDLFVRTLFSVQAPPNSVAHLERPGATVTLALVDLPHSVGVGGFDPGVAFPYTAILEVWIDGALAFEPRITITGADGVPNEILDVGFKSVNSEELWTARSQPTLRFRPKRAPGTFAIGQAPIGAIEFDFVTPDDCLQSLRVYPASEAANATAIVSEGTDGGEVEGEWYHVVLIDPKGIDLVYLEDEVVLDTTDETLAGQGPILDLSFAFDPESVEDETCAGIASPEIFSIERLGVYDVNGNLLFWVQEPTVDTVAAPSATATLRVYPVNAVPVE